MVFTGTVAGFMRVPAVPLATHSPMFSVWSFADRLNEDYSRHWTGRHQGIAIHARVDGVVYRLCGGDNLSPGEAAEQTACEITSLRSITRFRAGKAEIVVEWLSPVIPTDLRLLARPVTYVRVVTTGAEEVDVLLDVCGQLAVDTDGQSVTGGTFRLADDREAAFLRADPQRKLERTGDDHRLEWGTVALATEGVAGYAEQAVVRNAFASGEPFAELSPTPRRANDQWPVAYAIDGGPEVTFLLAVDEEHPVQYLGRPLPTLWREEFADLAALLSGAFDDAERVRGLAVAFDEKLAIDLERVGGPDYRKLCELAFRQCLAAYALVRDIDGKLHIFSKENFSNGCIGTVDVTYPAAPFFLHFNRDLMRAHLDFVMDYSRSGRWKFPFAPHDLGQYPKADGQVYGGGETSERDQMPVEECGNMLVLAAALEDPSFVETYRDVLDGWADYLLEKGLDPENQLCTDDFAGHLARNANLSVKAIVGLAAWGKASGNDRYSAAAKEMAGKWLEMARDDHGATRLVFGGEGTWSQKYNMVWDRVLDLGLWPQEVRDREVESYLARQNEYGLPLDSRHDYTKNDWILWSAVLTGGKHHVEALAAPIARWLEETPDRVPLGDWYDTKTGKHHHFRARSVVGGFFFPLFAENR